MTIIKNVKKFFSWNTYWMRVMNKELVLILCFRWFNTKSILLSFFNKNIELFISDITRKSDKYLIVNKLNIIEVNSLQQWYPKSYSFSNFVEIYHHNLTLFILALLYMGNKWLLIFLIILIIFITQNKFYWLNWYQKKT